MATARKIKKTATAEEFWAGMEELSQSQRETDRQLKKLEDLFTGQWGKLMQSLVEGDLIKLLNERDIEVNGIAERHKREVDGKTYEFDIIAINGDEVVVVEVKTTLGKRDIDHLIKKLNCFKGIFREYSDKMILGAVAYLKENTGAATYAEKKGLFVIRATGSSASIINKQKFKPKAFC